MLNAYVSNTLNINSQIIYSYGADGFSVNEKFNAGNASTTAYHFTSGSTDRNIMFSIAKTANFTNMFGTYGTAGANTFVIASETLSSTTFEFRQGVGIAGGLNLSGGTLLFQIAADGQLYAPLLQSNVSGNALFFNSSTGRITYGSATGTSTDTQILFNNSGAIAGSSGMVFDICTGITTLSSLAVTNTVGSLNMNLNNLYNIYAAVFSSLYSPPTVSLFSSVSGGTQTIDISGERMYYTFTSNGSFTMGPTPGPVEYFAVGGGGAGGGSGGGGGGAGGLQTNAEIEGLVDGQKASMTLLPNAVYTVTIGAGGTGSTGAGGSGGDTTITGEGVDIFALGGGGGGNAGSAGSAGGCGGGGGHGVGVEVIGGSSLRDQGYSGGNATTTDAFVSGGGGGIAGPGTPNGESSPGLGGDGLTYNESIYGAGGVGGDGTVTTPGASAAANTGSGGGGGNSNGEGAEYAGSGGSGIFIISFPYSASGGVPEIKPGGYIRINPADNNLTLLAGYNIVLSPMAGIVTIQGLASNVAGNKLLTFDKDENVAYTSVLTVSEGGDIATISGKLSFGGTSYISNDTLSNINITGSTNPSHIIALNTTNGVYVGGNGGSVSSGTLRGFLTISGTVTATIDPGGAGYGFLMSAGANSTTGPSTAGYSLAMNGNAQALEFDATSDARLKNISGGILTDDAIRFMKTICGKHYSWKHDPSDGIVTGFIAQDIDRAGFRHIVHTIANEAVVGHIDPDGYVNPSGYQLTVNHNAMLPYYHTVIQNLLGRVEYLEATISSLMSSR